MNILDTSLHTLVQGGVIYVSQRSDSRDVLRFHWSGPAFGVLGGVSFLESGLWRMSDLCGIVGVGTKMMA